jgi:chromate transporter
MMYLQMFWEFFKTGLFAVGGGMATIPFLYEMSEKTGWFTGDQLANMIAVGESTPGPIGVNMATYVGFLNGMQHHGIAGAIVGAVVTTLGLITPSVIIIMVIAALLKGFRENRYVQSAFYGLRPASTGLIAAAGIQVVLTNLVDFSGGVVLSGINWKGLVLGVALWLLSNQVKATKKLHPIAFIGMAAVAGIVFQMG